MNYKIRDSTHIFSLKSRTNSAFVLFSIISDNGCNDFSTQLDGRVKTLHPNIHGGILARRDQKHHMEALSTHGIGKLCYQLCYK